MKTASSSGAPGGSAAAAVMGGLGQALSGGSGNTGHGRRPSNQLGDALGTAVGGGALGAVVGGLAGVAGGGLLGSAFEDDEAEKKKYKKEKHGRGGSFTSEVTETGYRPPSREHGERYGQARVSHTEYPSGGHRDEYQRYEQDGRGGHTGHGFQQTTEAYPTHAGGYTQRSERVHEQPGGRWESEVQEQHVDAAGQYSRREEKKKGKKGKKADSDDDSDDSDDDSDDDKKERKRRMKEEKKMGKIQEKRRSGGPKSPRHERKHSR